MRLPSQDPESCASTNSATRPGVADPSYRRSAGLRSAMLIAFLTEALSFVSGVLLGGWRAPGAAVRSEGVVPSARRCAFSAFAAALAAGILAAVGAEWWRNHPSAETVKGFTATTGDLVLIVAAAC